MPFISRKNINELRRQNEAMRTELKGYYEAGSNAENQYLRLIADGLRGLEFAPVTPIDRLQIKRIYETSAPVYGVINLIAGAAGEIAQYLELTDKNGTTIENHWLLDLLRHPNDRYTLKKMVEAWAINRSLYGDAWRYAPKSVGADLGKVKEMYIIPSWRIEVDRDGVVQPIRGIQLLGTKPRTIQVRDLIEDFNYNLDDTSAFGTSPLVTAALYLSVMERGMRREDTALNNGGVANIVTPAKDSMGIMPKDADQLEKEVNGKEAWGKTKALRIPVDVHQLGNAPVDLSILESHKEAVTALCFVYHIPVDLYYGQSKYENAKEAKKTIYEQNAIPMVNEFAEGLLHHCGLDKEGYRLMVNTDKIDVLQDDPKDVLENLTRMHATLNELREAYGYDAIDEDYANQPMLQMGTVFGNEEAYDINEE